MAARRGLALILLVALAVTGCARADGAPRPAEVALGVDACEVCHMAIDDPGLAAQFVEARGKARKFDAAGCLVEWMRANPEAAGAAFVADHDLGGWIAADRATFVLRDAGRAGMGRGVLAFRGRAAAEARAAASGGRVADWATLLREGVDDAHAH